MTHRAALIALTVVPWVCSGNPRAPPSPYRIAQCADFGRVHARPIEPVVLRQPESPKILRRWLTESKRRAQLPLFTAAARLSAPAQASASASAQKLAHRALAYLPSPKVRPTPAASHFAMLAMPDVAAKLVAVVAPVRLARARDEAARYPSRIFANALVNTAWRNGPVENIHAGRSRGYPLDRRRVTAAEERTLFAFATDRLTTGMVVCQELAREQGRSWSEQVVPYSLAEPLLITPSDWTLTEATRAVRIRRS